MTRVGFGMLAGVGLAAIAWWFWMAGSFGDLTRMQSRTVRAAIAQEMQTDAVRLVAPVLARTDRQGWLVCGWAVDAGPLGALGAVPFIGLLSSRGTFGVAGLGLDDQETAAIRSSCAARGMNL